MGPRRKSEMSKLHKIAISESLTNISSGLCVVNSKTSSKRRHRICYIDRTSYRQICFLKFLFTITLDTLHRYESDLKNFQELTEIWISSHSENVHLTLPRDLSSNLAPHALSRRLRSANIRDKKKNPSDYIRSTVSRMFRGSKSDSESKR